MLARRVLAFQQQETERHQLRLEAARPAVVGLWDGRRLERALQNLVDTAIHRSADGGLVRVSLRQEADRLGAWAVLDVEDQGSVMPAEDLGRVFERHHHVGGARDLVGLGTGLAYAWQVVTLHGGTAHAESRAGQGTRFTLRLPLLPRTEVGD